ncbi:death-inducer obliterator 1-like [Solanum tuberosum]|nr:PREDICTED: death-inducer obliterator 1-like [Solanum tuberosum]XP_015168486.1 PREDICTED: death-inducer obliterator 1-like [Solanum tuberosum]
MSSDLVSQQFSGPPDGQLIQMDHVSNNPDSIAHMQTSIVGHVPNISASQQLVWSNEPTANRFDTSLPVNQLGPMGPRMNPQHFMLSHQQTRGDRYVPNSPGVQKSSVLTKRKAEMSSMPHGSTPQVSSMPNKRTAQGTFLSASPGFVQQSSAIKKPGQQQSKLTSGGSTSLPASSKKLTRNESISNRTASQRSQTPKGRTIQVEPTSKAQSESSDAIRSKMRESLASALAMACQNPAAKDLSEAVGSQPSQLNVTPTTANEGLPQTSVSHVPQNSGDVLPSTGPFPVDRNNDDHSSSLGLHDDVSMVNSVPCSTELELHVDDVPFSDNFFVKDELLQGNGLTWAMDLDMQLRETDFLQDAEKANLFDEDVVEDKGEHAKSSPEDLALHIEEELFKLFGGVNKKYKERGRSLLFNLKDRSNPELRERVMSGELPPDKLCSMTAEELASKELSEWRVAKAEELAQMVVLPDNAIDMRRLVKKTHKGEYQVDFERDDNNIASEISAGSNVTQFMPKKDGGRNSGPSGKDELGSKENLTSQRNNSEKQDVKDSLVIPADGADLMQGMVVEEFKDAEFLPPIVSLVEFMESLDSEPPFENLPVENNHSAPLPDKESSEDPNNAVGSGLAAKYPVVASEDKSLEGVKNHVEQKESLVSAGSPVAKKVTSSGDLSPIKMTGPRGSVSRVPCIWEGELQLTISSLVTVFGSFRSGEKTPTNEWPSSLEIKGRVRLDAFEKFLQELPMSRSRAVMVVQFVLKDKSSERERADLSEAVHSYASDERLGFAEPAPGVELYLCPPHILDMISKHLSKDPKELYDSTENGLIGVVVWRKLHISSTISPNSSSSHHKHSLKKQQAIPRGQHEKAGNVNVNSMPKAPMSMSAKNDPAMDDDDDIPPGFGPKAGRDDDDLPEFNFSGNINASRPRHPSQNMYHGSRMNPYNQTPPSRPVDQMRELILKYGQTGATNVGPGTSSWNDDDDDIPEWRPQAPPPLQRPPYPLGHSFPQPLQPPQHLAHQRPLATPMGLPMQPPINNGIPNRPQIMSPRGQYQVDWRRDQSRGRGF